jgi:two-component system sensor kinase FixL
MTVTAQAVADGRAVEVTVADTGVGISSEDMRRIMEPLFTTKTRGLGLGLAIVRAILDKNGGELRVASEPGRGSAFTVRLAAAPEDSALPPRSREKPSGNGNDGPQD